MTLEKQNFVKLPVKDLAKKTISDGHLYLSSGQRKFYLMKPGIFIDPNFVQKHAANNSTFDFVQITSNDVVTKFKELFRELKYLQFEKDLQKKCFEILRSFYEIYSGPEHYLSFAIACHEEFCKVPKAMQSRLHETDMHLYRKCLYSGAFAVINGIANDFYHFLMLQDFYNLTFCLDIGLCDENYSYYVAEACNSENKNPGSGKFYLDQVQASKAEKEIYLGHPEKSYAFIKQESILSYSELAEAIRYQHELADGTGFPRRILKGQVSTWEAVVIFSDSLVEISSDYQFETSVISFMMNFHNQKLSDLPVGRVYKRLKNSFDYMKGMKETGS
jgi:hypothetical protein